ncbi:HNH endonuclease family protein [Janibacter alittae]|uniref:HNH endonuclease family protein n=1 Tax=Janibacter alittae TaxID=3115209 RepID=A0ABZ2MKV0_9MICO
MSTRSRGGLAILLASVVASACTAPGGPTAATTTVTETASATTTASPTTVTPSPVTVTETAPTPAADGPGGTSTAGASSPTLDVLESLPVKGRAPRTGYDRAQFGQAWSDAVEVDGGHNGCDTRNDVLRRDLAAITLDPSTGGCVVLTGTLQDPFTSTTISFVRGRDTSREVQIDHLVALSNAWQTGAQQLGAQQRENLANDPLNLLAVHGSANAHKGDGDAATWLPRTSFRCDYAARQVAVKQRYDLWVTPPEHDALTRILDSCPGQPLPTPAGTGVPARGAP